jgi:hypothetical protein
VNSAWGSEGARAAELRGVSATGSHLLNRAKGGAPAVFSLQAKINFKIGTRRMGQPPGWNSGFVYTGAVEESVANVSNGVGVVETTAGFVKDTPAAQAEIRQFLRSQGVKWSVKHVSKDAALLGKVAGAFAKVLAAKSAYDRYQKCRGY